MIYILLAIAVLFILLLWALLLVSTDRETDDKEQMEWIREWNTTRHTPGTKKNSTRR